MLVHPRPRYTRTTLYFGLARPAGTITEKQWKVFVREDISRVFPRDLRSGKLGQWRSADGRMNQERAKVLLLVHANSCSP